MVFKKIMLLCLCTTLIMSPMIAKKSAATTDSTLKKVCMNGKKILKIGVGACLTVFGIYSMACSVENFFKNGLSKKNVWIFVGAISTTYCGGKIVLPLVQDSCLNAKKMYDSRVKKTMLKDEYKTCHGTSD